MTHTSESVAPTLLANTTLVSEPIELLDYLGPDGFAYLDGPHGFVTSGVASVVEPDDAVPFLQALPHDRDDAAPAAAGPRAVGALPFRGTGRLFVPAVITGRDAATGLMWCTRIEPAVAPAPLSVAAPRPTRFGIEPLSTEPDWHDAVARVLDEIAAGRATKVVLARPIEVTSDTPFDVRAVLAELLRAQPGCTIYADGGFVGASPELLVRKWATNVLARPLAGTGRDADRLAASGKDAREHHLVVDAVKSALAAQCRDVRADGPNVRTYADVSHLATTITAVCHHSDVDIVKLVHALHPTPAVAGTPTEHAVDLIAKLEPMDRGRYGGPCGWVDANGNGEFVVALRGADIDGTRARCWAGAGIVAGSDSHAEWAETQMKFDAMLRALVRP
jgi:menaquinone-specific isochorismate synthase